VAVLAEMAVLAESEQHRHPVCLSLTLLLR